MRSASSSRNRREPGPPQNQPSHYSAPDVRSRNGASRMIQAFFYDADGHDHEVDLNEEHIRNLDHRTLLWVDVKGRDRAELEHVAMLFGLDAGSVREILNPQEALYLDNYGEYFQFDIIGLARDHEE